MVLAQKENLSEIKANKYQKAISQIIRDMRWVLEEIEFYRSKNNLKNDSTGEILDSDDDVKIVFLDQEELYFEAKKQSLTKVKKIIIYLIHKYVTDIDFSCFTYLKFKKLENNLEMELQTYIENFNKEFSADIEKWKVEKIEFSLLSENMQKVVNSVSTRAFELVA